MRGKLFRTHFEAGRLSPQLFVELCESPYLLDSEKFLVRFFLYLI